MTTIASPLKPLAYLIISRFNYYLHVLYIIFTIQVDISTICHLHYTYTSICLFLIVILSVLIYTTIKPLTSLMLPPKVRCWYMYYHH